MGQLNIKKRGKVYQYQFEIARVNGKRKYINKSGFKTKAEAIEEGNKAYTEYLNAGVPFKECSISYSDYLDYWLENYCKTNLKYNTIQAYKTLINKYIKPKLGMYRLSTITSVTLNSFIIELCNQYDFSRSYFGNILKVVKGSFREACNLYGFLKYNPAITLRLPKLDKIEEEVKHLYTQKEIDNILKRFSKNDTFTCAFLTSCFTGMRTGEVCALTWNDIDLKNGIISVKHNVYDKPKDENGRWYIGSTKTPTGTRHIYVCQTLLNALKNYKKKQSYLKQVYGSAYKYYHLEDVKNEYGKVVEQRIVKNKENVLTFDTINLVFTREDGSYVGTDLTKYPFKIIHEELGIKKCRFYDLRGSYATKILTNGVEIRDVADILGHRNIETTENYYISSTEDSRKRANKVFEEITHSNIINEIIKYQV
ncbi:tyrosine-type recombinase/integrase [uncultured Clostridium sp.]|jgi:integrase|uniref:tyrosine-type recombinase/integrase n=1 Tax=uncultured Clostridium sp. TaxID=59620 RepID=UPI00272BAD02|nr:tyrosine-type recombinase/integrase [uncultured Clostridium sp.]